jgi:hypothetical protein
LNAAIHSATASTGQRIAVSPYARRLARDQQLALSDVRGSGPGGRIVAVDIRSHRPPQHLPASEPPPTILAAASPQSSHGGLGATANIAALSALLAQFAAMGKDISIEDVLLRAAAKALAAIPGKQISGAGVVVLETAKGDQILIAAENLSVAAQRARRLATDAAASIGSPAELSLWLTPSRGIRASFLPLRPGRPLRLVVSVSSDEADLLLVFCTETISETRAAGLVEAIRDYLESGLGLFA